MTVAAPATTQQYALDRLRELIAAGALVPGGRVNQEDVAGEIGVSVGSVREALRVLEQEGQLTYLPRRGYFVTELRIEDLEEIYALRRLLEERAARAALPTLTGEDLGRIDEAAAACADAVEQSDVAAELAANRRFHLAILAAPGQPHTHRIIERLWDATEAYRARYYSDPAERRASLDAHDRILRALRRGDADRLVRALDAHREAALRHLRRTLRAP